MTEFLCNSLGYSKQAYYKSLRSSNEGEERERYVIVKRSAGTCPAWVFSSYGRC